MKRISYYIVERLHINKDIGKHIEYNYHPTSRDELKQLVNKLIFVDFKKIFFVFAPQTRHTGWTRSEPLTAVFVCDLY